MKTIALILMGTMTLAGCDKPAPAPDKPIRHCVDKNNKVVDESQCGGAQAGGMSGMHWLFLYMLLRPGQSVPATYHHNTVIPASGFTSHSSALAAPAPTKSFTSSAPTSLPKSSSPVRSSPSITIPKSSSTYRSTPSRSYSSPSRSYSSPSRSSSRYR